MDDRDNWASQGSQEQLMEVSKIESEDGVPKLSIGKDCDLLLDIYVSKANSVLLV
jgi:hypothetical protein